ncbi:precorrin-6A reductase [Halanaerobium hydrogeniformans]|uniref:Precorrin-6x reductase n=1 Tax=Halanaerobium hydrogeniformans TaxID=656519 RepID=E4RK95_HALHG|nr:precorrin-6A reductase [Halanaerobium hydrogeniformans]ADQ15608.1 precorrin-6x reductase [Halanaerobium hydrogeniformans]
MIWILAGTSDSYRLIEKLKENIDINIIATAATDYGKKLLDEKFAVKAIRKRLSEAEMQDFINEHAIKYIIDASHPFAEELSRNAILAAEKSEIVYLRYERKSLDLSIYPDKALIKVKNYLEAAEEADKFHRIFLSTGSKTADIFVENIDNFTERLFFRILPAEKFLKKLIKLGLTPANIAALQGPFSREFNQAMFKEYKADVLVTKASGNRGGLKTKIEAALELNIPIIIIERPEILYPQKFEEINNLIEYLKNN